MRHVTWPVFEAMMTDTGPRSGDERRAGKHQAQAVPALSPVAWCRAKGRRGLHDLSGRSLMPTATSSDTRPSGSPSAAGAVGSAARTPAPDRSERRRRGRRRSGRRCRGVIDLRDGGGAALAQAHAGRDTEESDDGAGRVLRGRGRGASAWTLPPAHRGINWRWPGGYMGKYP